MVGRLILFYIGSMIVLIGVVPWDRIQPGADVTASPFVTVFQLMGIPAAAHLVNFVVLTAALSSINCNFYLVTRMMFSLARGGYAPGVFGNVSRQGTPVNALLISTFGLALATVMAALYPRTRVRLHVRHRAVRRAVHLADDFPYSPALPPSLGTQWRAAAAGAHAGISVHDACWVRPRSLPSC